MIERRLALDGPVGELGRQAEISGVKPGAACFAVQRAVRPGVLLEDTTDHGVSTRARGGHAGNGVWHRWFVRLLAATLYADGRI